VLSETAGGVLSEGSRDDTRERSGSSAAKADDPPNERSRLAGSGRFALLHRQKQEEEEPEDAICRLPSPVGEPARPAPP
jgi:hypothetical protein